MKNLKRTIPAALATVGLLAGGVAMAGPASAENLVNIDVGVGVPGWTFAGPGKPRYQYAEGTFSGVNYSDEWLDCGGLFAPSYSDKTQICSFDIDDAGIASAPAAKIAFPAWKVTSPGGKTYDVAYSSGVIGNPPVYQGFEMVLAQTETSGKGSAIGTNWQLTKPGDYLLMITPDQSALLSFGANEASDATAASESPVGAAADVTTESVLGDADADTASDDTFTPDADGASDDTSTPDADGASDDATTPDADGASDDTSTPDAGDASDDTTTPDADTAGATVTRAGVMTKHATDHQVIEKHQTRVEKMATKVHNSGGVLTIHAYGPDEILAMARARAVRKHLEDHLAKRGYTGPAPIHVVYAGDPDHKGTHVTIHWHADTTLPGALPGSK